jgi:hypothetical protein
LENQMIFIKYFMNSHDGVLPVYLMFSKFYDNNLQFELEVDKY